MAFVKYPAILELEEHHGVDVIKPKIQKISLITQQRMNISISLYKNFHR